MSNMDETDIRRLASRPKETMAELELRMAELKSRGVRILGCILYVKVNQGCSLSEATDIVINTSAWVEDKNEFLQQQADAFQDFIQANMSSIEKIEQTFTADGTETIVHLKRDHSRDNTG